ncbi:MAG: PDZ domain-containing protein [Planctomycetes bacterium]|nr:PDZ domain-containing protein [Planctomycetota bacterium]
MRLLCWIVLLAAPVLAQESGGGAGADLARLFPADTFAYVEVDASAPGDCLPEWQIGKILADPALKTLFGPAFQKLGIDPEKPGEALLKRVPLKEVLDGRAAVGVRGMSFVMHDAQGRDWKFRVSPGAPIDAKHMYRLLGMSLALDGPAGRKITFDVDVDFLAVGRPGLLGRQWIEEALAELGGEVTRKPVKILGLDATHVAVNVPVFGGFSYGLNFYATERDGTWFLATQPDTLEHALSGGPRASLAASASLAQARARFTNGRPLLLAHVDLGLLFDAYRGLVPKTAEEMGDIAGINAIRGVGFGISLVDGGVRESLGIMLDGNPRGAWKILDGMPAGIRSIEVAPPGALAAFAVKLDLKVLRERILAFCADVVPGNEAEIDREITREFTPPGLDLVNGVIPALGDEVALLVYPARGTEMFPGFVLGADAKDEEALARLVAAVQGMVPEAVARFAPADLPEGIRAVRVMAAMPYDIHFAIHKRHFLLASSPKLLGEAAAKWGAEGEPRLVRDDAVLPLVLKAVNGGDTKGLAALAYVNLRGCGAEAMKAQMMWGQFLPREWLDPRGMGEMRRIPNHLTGAAISLRHDGDGLVLDCFSPVGLLVPAVVAGTMFAQQPQWQQAVPAPPRPGTGRPSLGVTTKSSDGTGVKVLGLAPGGAAARGGLRQGDKVIGLDGVQVATMEDLDRELAKRKPGEIAQVRIRRGDEEVTVPVELGEEQEAGW